jgi:RNA polymerase sigma-70 factor, ECF subfamily
MSAINPDPVELLQQARGGNAPALGRLLELYQGYLALLARLQLGRRVQGKVDVSDLIQETFMAACRAFPAFRGGNEGELTAWLRQILAHQLARAIRHYYGTQRRDLQLEQQLVQDLDRSSAWLGQSLEAPHSSPSEQAARREQAVLLARAMEQLPNDYREAIILRHLEGLPFDKVAYRMGRSTDSVKKLWARGLGQLRRLVGGAP